MSELRLDYQPYSPIPWIGIVVLVLALITLILTGTYYYGLSSQVSNLEDKVVRAKDRGAQHDLANRSTARSAVELAQEVTNANDVLRHLSVPWDSLFHAVESSGGHNVTLLAIEPDVEKQQVKIQGEAKNFSALMSYITHLQGQAVFGSVYLQNHDVQKDDPDKPVRFSLLADWQEKS
jgi:hypothetical protein